MNALDEARQLLGDVTPLRSDCGLRCGHACCLGSGQDGMILLPGEAHYYTGQDWCRIREQDGFSVLVCSGSCPRSLRPFACRLFPLRISVTPQHARLIMDPLAASVCPLAEMQLSALDSSFVSAAGRAAKILLRDPEIRTHLQRETDRVRTGMDSPLFDILK